MKVTFKAIITTLLTGVIALSMTGCTGTTTDEIEPKPYPVSVLNMKIENEPNAVASLSPAITQMLLELGFKDKIVGYSNDCVAENATDQNRIGTGLEPNLEAIGKVAPEFVFTNVPLAKEQLDKLDAVNVRVMVMPTANDEATIKQRYVDLVTIMGGQFDGDTIGKGMVTEIERQLEFVKSNIAQRQSFLYIATLDPAIATEDTIQGVVASYIGDNVATGHSGYNVPKEAITALAPQIIIYDESISPEAIKESELFSKLEAVKSGKMYPVKGSDMTLSTASLVKAVQTLATSIYPDVNFVAPAALPPSSEESSK